MKVIGVDMGATNLKVARVNRNQLEDTRYVPVHRDMAADELLEGLYHSIGALITPDCMGIGIGVPTVVDPETGTVYDVQNIPSWKAIPLRRLVENRFQLPVAVNNDANCFAIGEKVFGRAKEISNFAGITVGTGLGMGIVINNNLYNGILSGAGEIGMLPYKDDIVESYAGSFFFTRFYQSNPRLLHEQAMAGSAEAREAFRQFGIHLGEALKMVLYMLAPEAVILGGSICKAYDYFRESMLQQVQTFAYPDQIKNLIIEVSTLQEPGILGAAALCYGQDVNQLNQ